MAFYRSTLQNRLMRAVNHGVFRRGLDLQRSGAVDTEHASVEKQSDEQIFISTKVHGSGGNQYTTSLLFNIESPAFLGMECTCPYEDDCKHAVALALECIEVYAEVTKSLRLEHIATDTKSIIQMILDLFENEPSNTSIRDAEIEEAESAPPNSSNETTEEKLQKHLASLGIRPDALPKHVLDILRLQMQEKTPDTKMIDLRDSHCIILSPSQYYGVNMDVSFLEKNEPIQEYFYPDNHTSPKNTAKKILNQSDRALNPEQKTFLSFLTEKNPRQERFDWIRFFTLLQASGISAYRVKWRDTKKIPHILYR